MFRGLSWEAGDMWSDELGAAPKKKPAPKKKAPPKSKTAPKAKAPPKPKPAPKKKAPPKPKSKPTPKAKAAPKPKPAPKAKAAPKPKPAPKAKAAPKPKPSPKAKTPKKAKPTPTQKKLAALPPAKKAVLRSITKSSPTPAMTAPSLSPPFATTDERTLLPESESSYPEAAEESESTDMEETESTDMEESEDESDEPSEDESDESADEPSDDESADEPSDDDEIGAIANRAVAKACRCPPDTAKNVRKRLDGKMQRRGYPPGTSDKLLASIVSNQSRPAYGPISTPVSRFDDEELGFIVEAGKAAGKMLGGIGKGIKKIVTKKKTKAKAKAKAKAAPKGKVIQMDPIDIVGTVPTPQKAALTEIVKSAAKVKAAKGKASPRDVVAELTASIPPLVRTQVLEALKAAKDSAATQAQTLGTISEQVDSALQPKITAMLAALQTQQTSQQATYEHENLVKRAEFERSTSVGLSSILTRLDGLEQSMALRLKNPKIAIVTQKLPIYGPKSVLEG